METKELLRILKPRMVKAARERVGSAHHCLTV
jgi:hypothetical protein